MILVIFMREELIYFRPVEEKLMNVLLLSDFSRVAINATHYAMDLLQDQQVNFHLLNIFDPDPECSGQAPEAKKAATLAELQERVQKLQERSGNRPHKVMGHYSEDKPVYSARDFIGKQKIDLIVMGAVGEEQRHSTILGKHTFEIVSKIKCNMLAVPDDHEYHHLEKILLPLDHSASFRRRNLQFLTGQKIFRRRKLSVWEMDDFSTINPEERFMNKEAFSDITGIKINFSTIDKTSINSKDIWKEVQKKFQLVCVMGKNIRICHVLMNDKQGLFRTMPNRLPILVLHD